MTKAPVPKIKYSLDSPPPKKFQNYCQIILRDPTTDPYAKTYAQSGVYLTDPEECRVQALYIRSNLSQWRGDKAREVKAALDFYADKAHIRYL